MSGKLAIGLDLTLNPVDCSEANEGQCFLWKDVVKLKVTQLQSDGDVECVNYHWEALSKLVHPTDCFDIGKLSCKNHIYYSYCKTSFLQMLQCIKILYNIYSQRL